METTKSEPTTESLRMSLVKRILLVVLGCIAESVLAVVLPALYLVAVRSETTFGPGSGPTPAPGPGPLLITPFIPPIILLVLLGLIIYGVYDTIRVFSRYRKSQQNDQMFP